MLCLDPESFTKCMSISTAQSLAWLHRWEVQFCSLLMTER